MNRTIAIAAMSAAAHRDAFQRTPVPCGVGYVKRPAVVSPVQGAQQQT